MSSPVELEKPVVIDRVNPAWLTLQARLASAHEEIARLKAENRTVRERLTNALGDTWRQTSRAHGQGKQQPPRQPRMSQAGR